MSKKVFVGGVLVILGWMSVAGGTIKSINVNYVNSVFTASGGDFGLGTLSLSDAADIVVEDTLGNQTTYTNGSFSMATSLAVDVSAGGIASGQFTDGSLSFLDSGANALLSGDVVDLNLIEIFNNVGILAGEGQFTVTGGSLSSDFVPPVGDIVQITFQVVPASLGDFSQDFTGVSNFTLTPIPEPAIIAFMSIGGLFLIRRKR